MLEGLRRAQQNWLGKIIITVLFSILIVSFAMVFVQPYMTQQQANTVITAGKTSVPFQALEAAFREAQVEQGRRQGKPQITPREAQAMQLDQQVVGELVSFAVLDENARRLGLAISDDMVRQHIFALPRFQSAIGFDKAALDSYLRDRGMTESGFVAEQRAVLLREQLGGALTLGAGTPLPMQELAFRLLNEKRDIIYYVLTEANAGTIPAPTREQLDAAYQQNKAQFRAPEYRSFEAISVAPDNVPKPAAVSDDDARKAYETLKATRYPDVERRAIQQIIFPNDQEARDALARLKAGSVTFDALAAERKIAPEALTIGNLTKQEVLDPAVADAAFALPEGQVSDVVATRLGPAVLRVARIGRNSFDDVKDELKNQMTRERAARAVGNLRDEIEDMAANAKPFAEIAKEKNLPIIRVAAVDKTGLDMSGKPVEGLPDAQRLVQAVFASDIGVDNISLQTADGGYIWYRVTNVTPSRDRTLDEIAPQITDIWKRDEVGNRLSKLAADQAGQIKTADDLRKMAAAAKAEAKTAQQLTRASAPPADFSGEGLLRVFATPAGQPATAANASNRIVFLVTAATVPAFNAGGAQIGALNGRFGQQLANDLIVEYINTSQKELGVTVDQNVVRRLYSAGAEN